MAGGYRYNPKSWYASGTRRYMRKASGIYFFDGKQSNRVYTEEERREAAREANRNLAKFFGIVFAFKGLVLASAEKEMGAGWGFLGIILIALGIYLYFR